MRTETGIAAVGYRATPIAQSATTPAPISLHAVNGWRGVGALAIAFGHFWLVTDLVRIGDFRPIALLVDLFFVLSGMLISQAYMDKLHRVSAIPEYIVRRFGRIWPIHATMLAVLVAYELVKLVLAARFHTHFSSPPFTADGPNSVAAIGTNLLLIHSLGLHRTETWDFPSWSLSVEFATYAIFALFCLMRPFMRRATSVAVVVFSLFVLAIAAPHHMRSTYDYGVFRCTAGFFAGSLLCDVLKHVRLPTWPLPTLVELSTLGLTVTWTIYGYSNGLAFAAPMVFCLFVLGFIHGRGLVSRILLTKPFQFLAELSFTIYMVHAVILMMLLAALHAFERADGLSLFTTVVDPHPLQGASAKIQVFAPRSSAFMAGITFVYFTSVLATSFLAYRYIEIPGRLLFGSLAKRLPAFRLAQHHSASRHHSLDGMGPG